MSWSGVANQRNFLSVFVLTIELWNFGPDFDVRLDTDLS